VGIETGQEKRGVGHTTNASLRDPENKHREKGESVRSIRERNRKGFQRVQTGGEDK